MTDLITDDCLDWLGRRDLTRPFALFCHHKAAHRTWQPDVAHLDLFVDRDIAEPSTLFDDHVTRSAAVRAARLSLLELRPLEDLKAAVPLGLSDVENLRWRYQRFIKDDLRVIASLDDNVGRLLDHLDESGLNRDTIVIYALDQGFFLGDHGWFDKRMYEESLMMPLLVRYPAFVSPGSVCNDLVVNVDFAPTILELAGCPRPAELLGRSLVPLLRGEQPDAWRTSVYYRYWMHRDGAHRALAHYGVRTHEHKLICFYNDPLGQPSSQGPADQECPESCVSGVI